MRQILLAAVIFFGLDGPVLADGASDVAAFRQAVTAAAAGDWDRAALAVATAGPVARSLVRWQHLRAGVTEADGGLVLRDYADFVAQHPDWPGLKRLRRVGEQTLTPDLSPDAVARWFADEPAQTGRGIVAHAQALRALGRMDDARDAVRSAWLTLGLSREEQGALLADWDETLIPLAPARADAMLWRTRVGDTERILPLLSEDQRALARARIALIRQAPGAWDLVDSVPADLADDPGLARDRMNRLVQENRREEAVALMLSRSEADDLGEPVQWAARRMDLARWLLRDTRPREALALAAEHGLGPEGDTARAYVELEWLAGRAAFMAGESSIAHDHFNRAETAATSAAWRTRAAFWAGRASEAADDDTEAVLAYARAAEGQTTFYGLLASDRLGVPLDPALYLPEDFGDWREGTVIGHDLVAAMLLLDSAGEVSDAALFAMKLGQTLDHDEIGQLGALLDDTEMPFLAITLARQAADRGIMLPGMLFPLHPLRHSTLPVTPDLALAVARQESNFNTRAGSGAGALGLMQLMPATAEEVARRLGLPWERARLTGDWEYNATLGSTYLEQLQEMFGRSPVLIAAGYNAGPSRPRRWLAERGDPRRGEADAIDWIEDIPFTETRNYVMRVLEAIPIYRAQLSGQGGAARLQALIIGEVPRIRPRARPSAVAQSEVPEAASSVTAQGEQTPTPAAPLVSARPTARP